MPTTADPILDLTAGIAAAYVSRHSVAIAEIPDLLRTVRDGLATLASPASGPAQVRPMPEAVRASIQADGLISFLDGRPYKTLKRHLTAHGLDPQGYRTRFGLPADYPMVAPGYAARRSEIARAIQLGGPVNRTAQQAAE